ncbi:MAG: hypothetical protein K8F30_05380 [Taibaiella sp.]|nr:hypothetical protein [Taibaiella sp.]
MPEFMIPPADAMMTPWGPIWLSTEGIIINIGAKSSQTREDVIEYLSYIKKAAAGKPRPFLVEISRVRSMSKEVREEYDKHNTAGLVTAMALVTKSAIGNMLGNILIGVSTPKVPTKLFTDPVKAKTWLMQYTN